LLSKDLKQSERGQATLPDRELIGVNRLQHE
jgi:hypothetical protein